MLPWSAELAGRMDEHVITSELLRDNPLGDPYERPLVVYVPPGYDDDPARRYAAVYVIQGYTGHLAMWRNRSPYRQPFPETADAVFASGQAPGAIVGKSSGGFGAMITPMLRPDLFGALATHAGDSLYELGYIPEFGKSARHLRDYDGDIWRWWEDFRSRVSFTKEADHDLLMLLGVSAWCSATPDGRVELPCEPGTARRRPDVWQRWRDWDPVRMVTR